MFKRILGFFKETFGEFSDDDAMTLAGSVAYYAALSFAPLILLFITITGMLGHQTQQRMVQSVQSGVGSQAGQAVSTVAQHGAPNIAQVSLSMLISVVVIIFSASGVLSALQSGLNSIWDVKASPREGVKGWIRKRLISMGMVLVIGFLLLLSLVVTSVIEVVMPSTGIWWNLLTLAVSLAVFVVLFAMMFKFLPDVKIAWSDVWAGAAITALLFGIGKFLMGLLLARSDYSKSYGAAGSIIALLVWVYYAAVVFYLGAEATQVLARRRGREIKPDRHSVHYRIVMDEGQTPSPA